MGFANAYLAKHSPGNFLIEAPPANNIGIIAVIPAYNESGLIESLDSLYQCTPPQSGLEIIVVINWPFSASSETVNFNLGIAKKARKWALQHNQPGRCFHISILKPGDKKNSGVGYARKTGMDEAVFRFNRNNCKNGLILSLDADVKTQKNYFTETESYFLNHSNLPGFNIYFEHELQGDETDSVYQGIAFYELHMRYYLQGLRYAGHPNSYHTLGSAFAVKAADYCKQGGMNKKQAGEDFYFLQKLFDISQFGECRSTTVFPSPRPSDRVPFGTGPVVAGFLNTGNELLSFNPELFEILKGFIASHPGYEEIQNKNFSFFETCHPIVQSFLEASNYKVKLEEIAENSADPLSFNKRFFRWFNMFRALKFLNFGKQLYPDIQITRAAGILLKKKGIKKPCSSDAFCILEIYRNLER